MHYFLIVFRENATIRIQNIKCIYMGILKIKKYNYLVCMSTVWESEFHLTIIEFLHSSKP